MNEQRQKIFVDRYALKGADGKPIETDVDQMWRRVARGLAEVEKPEDRGKAEKSFYSALKDFKFVPGGRILAGAGSGHEVTYFNCYVIPSPHDSRDGIFDNVKLMANIMAHGGGVGVNLSSLRPRGSYIRKVNGYSSGPVSWAQLYSVATGDVIQQGGCFAGPELIATDKGLISACELTDRIDAGEEFKAQTHKGFRRIVHAFRNGTKPLFKVTTRRGYSVTTTRDHKFATLFGSSIDTVPLDEFYGTPVLVHLGHPTETRVQFAPFVYEVPIYSTTLNTDVRLPGELTPDLAYWLGYLFGNGWLSQNKAVGVVVPTGRRVIRDRLVRIAEEVFGLSATIKEDCADDCDRVQFSSRILIEWLSAQGLVKSKAHEIEVPDCLLKAGSAEVGAFVAGYFDADGTDSGSKGGYCFSSVSLKFLQSIQILLAANGIVSSMTTYQRKQENWRTIYRLSVTGAVFKRRFAEFVSVSLKLKGIHGHRTEVVYDKSVLDGLPVRHMHYVRVWDPRSDQLSYHALSTIAERMAERGHAGAEEVAELTRVIPDDVVSVEPVDEGETYDFEVEDAHLLSGNGIYTSNSRRGALMLMLDDFHPDVEEFIERKSTFVVDPETGMNKPRWIEYANVSVCVSDALMQAVADDADWELKYPDMSDQDYDTLWDGDIQAWIDAGHKVKVHKTVKARDLWRKICESAHRSAEPGVVFMERCQNESNSGYWERIRCVNPCGEQPLGSYSVCNLGAVNLAAFVAADGHFDLPAMAKTVRTAVRMLDNVIDSTPYFLDENRANQQVDIRRTGLGTMGLADALIKMRIPYGSAESIDFINSVYATIRDAAYEASSDLAAERSPFGKFDAVKYLERPFIKRLPEHVRNKITTQGIRNALILTQAPTGTTSLLAGVSSGIEPVFAFAMQRRDRTGVHLMYHPLLEAWREEQRSAGIDPDNAETPAYFVESCDLTPEDHVRVQATIQKYTDSSISKTVNAPSTYTPRDIDRLYRLAYDTGCKGITCYVSGSRDAVLTKIDEKKSETKKGRPAELPGRTRKVPSHFGSVNVTVNEMDDEPFESFILVSKAGSELQAAAEAIGRLVSQFLRTTQMNRVTALRLVAEQLRGIGGSGSYGFGPNKVSSLPDAVGLAYQQMYQESMDQVVQESAPQPSRVDICPECGGASLVREEGCRKCLACGYSAC